MVRLAPMALRDVVLFNTVRNASREWLRDKAAYTLPEAVDWFRRGSGAQFLVIFDDGVPIGYCRVADGCAPWEKFIGMDVHPDYRGRGLAQLAYRALFEELRAAGVRQFRLCVLKTNSRARHIYDSLGFRPVDATVATDEEIEMVQAHGYRKIDTTSPVCAPCGERMMAAPQDPPWRGMVTRIDVPPNGPTHMCVWCGRAAL